MLWQLSRARPQAECSGQQHTPEPGAHLMLCCPGQVVTGGALSPEPRASPPLLGARSSAAGWAWSWGACVNGGAGSTRCKMLAEV